LTALTNGFQLRLYSPGDEEEIVQLLKIGFNGWPHFDLECTPVEHWIWKYLDNPSRTNFIVLATIDDRIVGANQILPMRIKIVDTVFPCVLSADTVVHSDYRGMGVYTKMANENISRMNDSGIQLDYFPTSNPILIESYSRRYRTLPFAVSNVVRIKDIDKQLKAMPIKNAWLVKLGFHGLKLFNDLKNAFWRKKPADTGFNIHEVKSFGESIERFWEKASHHYKFIIERRRDYLNWRYCDPRAGGFMVKEAKDEDGSTLGYCVLKINKYLKHYPIGYMVDLLALPDRIDVAESLVAEAIRYFDERNVNIVNCLVVENHSHEKILKRYGFIDSRFKIQIFMRPSSEMVNILKMLERSFSDKIHFSYGDIDSLPVQIPTYT